MKNNFRKFIAVVLAFAMVLSTIAMHDVNIVKAAAPDWSTVAYAGDGAGGGAYANLYKFYCETSGVSLVNIQQPGFASEAGLYVTFPAGISTCSLGDGNYDIQGAGMILHLSAFTAKETEFIVTDGLGTYTCYVYYENGTDSGETTTVDPDAPTTAPETSASAPSAPVGVVANINDLNTNYTIAFANVTGATSYKLYILDVETNTETSQAITNGGVVTITDAGLVAGKQYTFYVTAINDAGESAKSTGVTVTIPTTETEPVVDGTELLTQTDFTDGSVDKWLQSGGTYTNNGDGSVTVSVPAYTGGDLWATQLVQTGIQLVSGKWYKATVTLTSDIDKVVQLLIQKSDYSGDVSRQSISLTAGETKNVEVVFQANANMTVLYGIMMGYIDAANDAGDITISNTSLTVYNSEPETTPGEEETSEQESESESESESVTEEVTSEEVTTEAESESESESQGITVVDGTELLLQTEFAADNNSAWVATGCNNIVYNGDGSVDMTLPGRTTGAAHDSQFVQAGITLIAGKYYKAKFTISSDVYRTIEFRMQTVDGWVTHHDAALGYVPANGTIDVEVIFQAKGDTTNAQYGLMLGYFEGGSTQEANVTISNASLTVYNEQPEASPVVIYPIGPSAVTATAETPLQIDVSWVCDSAPEGQTYNVYLDDSETPIATGVTGTSYTITDVAEGDHTVTVEAVVGDKTSVKVKSEAVTVYPVPTLEEITSISAVGGMLEMVVSWTCPNASALQTYNIYLNGSETATVTGVKGNTYTLTVEEGTYSVTVKAALGEEVSTGLTVSDVTVLGALPDVLTSDRIAVEGFQIKTNGTSETGISFRTVCKAPNVGETITVGDTAYTVKNMGKIFVLDTNNNGYRKNDTLDTTYTVLNPTAVDGAYVGYKDSYRTKGFLATEVGIQNYWNPTDTENSYYVTTMTGMDSLVAYSIHVRAFVVATDSEGNEVLIYGSKTATTSIAQVASHIYTKSLAQNNTAHQYLYNAILNNSSILSTSNPYYRTATVVYGWDNILFVPDEKTAILDTGTLEELNGSTN